MIVVDNCDGDGTCHDTGTCGGACTAVETAVHRVAEAEEEYTQVPESTEHQPLGHPTVDTEAKGSQKKKNKKKKKKTDVSLRLLGGGEVTTEGLNFPNTILPIPSAAKPKVAVDTSETVILTEQDWIVEAFHNKLKRE